MSESVYAWAWKQSKIKAKAKFVLLAIAYEANDAGVYAVDYDGLQLYTKLSINPLKRQISELVSGGFIEMTDSKTIKVLMA